MRPTALKTAWFLSVILLCFSPGKTKEIDSILLDIPTGIDKILMPDPTTTAAFGSSIDVDGAYMIVGAPGRRDNDGKIVGAAYVYRDDGNGWVLESRLDCPEFDINNRFGSVVGISGDTAVVGAHFARLGTTGNQGAVYVFVRNDGEWNLQTRLDVTETVNIAQLGSSVSIDGDTIAAGAKNDDVGKEFRSGSIYVFSRTNAQWTRSARLTDPNANSSYGISVDIHKNFIAVGARVGFPTAGSQNTGWVDIFRESGSDWVKESRLVPSDGADDDWFGHDASIEDDTVLVGASSHGYGGPAAIGAVYIFSRSGNDWSEQHKLAPPNTSVSHFGASVRKSGDRILVGAPLTESGNSGRQGAAFTFVLRNGSWVFQNTLTQSDGITSNLGSSVAIQRNRFICGAPGYDEAGLSSIGALFIFTESPKAPDLQADSDSGISASDNITRSRDLKFDVKGITLGSRVELLRDENVVDFKVVDQPDTVLTDSSAPADGVFLYTTRQIVNDEVSSPSEGLKVTIDNTSPTLSLNQHPYQSDPAPHYHAWFQLIFSEPVIGFDVDDISLAGSTVDLSGAKVYLLDPQILVVEDFTSNGSFVQAQVPADSAVDPAGNSMPASISVDNRVTIDNVNPTVTVSKASGQVDPTTTADPLNFRVDFSEPVFDFDPLDVYVRTLGDTSGKNIVITGGGATYNVAIYGVKANGTGVSVSIHTPSNFVRDLVGNRVMVSTGTNNTVFVDNVRPKVTIDRAPEQPDPAFTFPIIYKVRFSEPVTGFDTADISFAGSTAGVGDATSSISGDGQFYTVEINGLVRNGGVLRVSIIQAAAQDSFGHLSFGSTGSDNSVTLALIADGGFESTMQSGQNQYWSSSSTTFGTPICHLALCGNGGGTANPRNGFGWVWFDGASGTSEERASISQSVKFPMGGEALLSYHLKFGLVSLPYASTLNVKIDGAIVQTVNEPSVAKSEFGNWTVDVSAYADGATHTISFEYHRPAGGTLDNFSLDDVALVIPQAPTSVTVSGRIISPDGRGLRNAVVSITDNQGARRTVMTSTLGYYSFDNALVGTSVNMSVASKRYRFDPRIIHVTGSLTSVDFIGLE